MKKPFSGFIPTLGLLPWLVLAAVMLSAQTAEKKEAPTVVPVAEEGHHHLVFENKYVKVFQVEVPAHGETLYHRHDRDYIFVTLGDSVVESVRLNEQPVKLELKDGETRFSKGGFVHKAVNLSDRPFRNMTVEVKKSYDGLQYEDSCNLDPQGVKKCIVPDIAHDEKLSHPPHHPVVISDWLIARSSPIPLYKKDAALIVVIGKGVIAQEGETHQVFWKKPGQKSNLRNPGQEPVRLIILIFR